MTRIDEIKKQIELNTGNGLQEPARELLSRLEIAIDALINVEQAIEEIVHEDGQTLNWDEVKTTLEDYVHKSIKKIRS